MDILAIDVMNVVITSFKIILVLGGFAVAFVNYFQIKEASKMERKMRIALPATVHFGMTFQFLLSVIFVFASTIYLFIF